MRQLLTVVISVLVLVVANVPGGVRAQSTDWSTVTYFVDLDGVNEVVYRSFQAPGARFVGAESVTTYLARFGSPEQAKAGISALRDRVFAYVRTIAKTDAVGKASIRKIGDQTVAYAGNLELLNPQPNVAAGFTAAFLFVRAGEYVYYIRGAAVLNVDPTLDTFAVARDIVSRKPGLAKAAKSAKEMNTGGLWDMLPTLDDVPEGFTFVQDAVPPPFDPIPDQ
jgi:hypothetical protein